MGVKNSPGLCLGLKTLAVYVFWGGKFRESRASCSVSGSPLVAAILCIGIFGYWMMDGWMVDRCMDV